MLKKFWRQFLLDLGEMEGDYRIYHLQDDKRQSSFYIIFAALSVAGMFGADAILFRDRPDLIRWMGLYRAGFVLISFLILIAIRKAAKVRVYDRFVLSWLWFVILFLLLFNFTRPTNFVTTAYDVILPFAIYIISPLKISKTFALASVFSAGILYIDYFHKTGIDTATLTMILIAQLIVHIIGLTSSIQIQSYRRKSFKAYIQERTPRRWWHTWQISMH